MTGRSPEVGLKLRLSIMDAGECYEFGEFTVDVTERRLMRAGVPVPLAPKAQDMLVALVRRAGMLVSKRELLDAVWPDTAVEEGILAVHISALRKALDAGRDSDVIETVSRAGYRFTAPVRRTAPKRRSIALRWPLGVLPAQPAVSDLIGQGRVHLLSASRSDVPKAVAAFRSATELDPDYAPAHAGLALACCAQAELRLEPADEAYTQARAAALRALAMDSSNAEAQVALGTVLFLSDWNWSGARRCLERALEIDPGHTEGWLLYGRLLEGLGDLEGGLAAKQKALERNPSAAVHLQIALSHWNARRYDEVIAWSERSLAIDPNHLLAREFLAGAWLMKGDVDRHMKENLAHALAAGAPPAVVETLGQIYAAGGRPAVLEYALRLNVTGPSVQLALMFGEVGKLDEAFRHLHLAMASHDPALVHLAVAPQWDVLRGDPRFDEALKAMGLTAHSRL